MAIWRWIGYSAVVFIPALLPALGCGCSEPPPPPPEVTEEGEGAPAGTEEDAAEPDASQ